MKSKGSLFVISAPSGAGKTTLSRALVQSMSNIALSVSYTTRAIRSNEKNGVDYHFINVDDFKSMLEKNLFLEQAKVFNNYYGTSQLWVEETRAKGVDVVLEIDWQGAEQIRALCPEVQGIFILPPSLETLIARLEERHPNNTSLIQERMKEAKQHLSRYTDYDYLVCNDKFENALEDLRSIVRANRLYWRRQHVDQDLLIKKLLS
jgi:guanylate kinase